VGGDVGMLYGPAVAPTGNNSYGQSFLTESDDTD
jgi:hypothetical protein